MNGHFWRISADSMCIYVNLRQPTDTILWQWFGNEVADNFGNGHCQNSPAALPLEILAGLLQIRKTLYEIHLGGCLRIEDCTDRRPEILGLVSQAIRMLIYVPDQIARSLAL